MTECKRCVIILFFFFDKKRARIKTEALKGNLTTNNDDAKRTKSFLIVNKNC